MEIPNVVWSKLNYCTESIITSTPKSTPIQLIASTNRQRHCDIMHPRYANSAVLHPASLRLPKALYYESSTSKVQKRTLVIDILPISQGTGDSGGTWDPLVRVKPIKLLEILAVTVNLRAFRQVLRHFSHFKVKEHNKDVVQIINEMNSKCQPIITRPGDINRLLTHFCTTIQSNCYLLSIWKSCFLIFLTDSLQNHNFES